MPVSVQRTLDFGGVARITNLPNPLASGDAATKAYVDSAVEGLAWKDSCRVAAQGNINILSPGPTIDGIVMVVGDRVLLPAQTNAAENGIYIWNGATVPMTRSLDMNTADEVEQAVTTVEEGTSAGVTYRQTAVNVTLGVTALTWSVFGTSAGPASESSAGIIAIATQAATNDGLADNVAVTPLKLANSVWAKRQFVATFGDGSATSYTLTHNLNTRDVSVEVYRNSGNYDTVLVEVRRTSVNAVTIVLDAAPAVNSLRAVIRA